MSSERIDRLKNFYLQEPSNQFLLNDLVEQYFTEDRLEQLVDFAESLDSDAISDSQIAHRVGIAGLVVGHYKFAESCFSKCFSVHPENAAIAYNYAFAKYAQHDFAKSLEILNSVNDFWQECAQVKLLAARCFHQIKELESALESIESFLQVEPTNVEGLGLKSLILLDNGEYQEAEKLSNQVLKQQQNLLEPLLAMSSSLIAQGEFDRAKNWVEQGIEKHPKVGRLWQNKGQLEMLNMQFDLAETSLKTAVKNMPNHIGTWHLLAWTQLITDKQNDARESFDSALALDRNFADSHGAIAMMDILSGNIEKAEEGTRRALKLDPRCATGLYAKSLLLEKQGEADRAKAIIEKIFASPTGQNALALLPQVREKFEGKQSGI